MKVDSSKAVKNGKGLAKKSKIVLILLIIVVIVIGSVGLYIKIQKDNAEKNRIKVNNEFSLLNDEVKKFNDNYSALNKNYSANKIDGESYLYILEQEPKAVKALNDYKQALTELRRVYDQMMVYQNDANIINETSDGSIKRIKYLVELSNNEFYEAIISHNNKIELYNTWALEKIHDPDSASFVETNNIKILDKYSTDICSQFIDVNNDGKFEGKEK